MRMPPDQSVRQLVAGVFVAHLDRVRHLGKVATHLFAVAIFQYPSAENRAAQFGFLNGPRVEPGWIMSHQQEAYPGPACSVANAPGAHVRLKPIARPAASASIRFGCSTWGQVGPLAAKR